MKLYKTYLNSHYFISVYVDETDEVYYVYSARAYDNTKQYRGYIEKVNTTLQKYTKELMKLGYTQVNDKYVDPSGILKNKESREK